MFASKTTSTVTIDDVVVTIQRLNWKALKKAARVTYDDAISQGAKLTAAGGAGMPGLMANRAAQLAEQAEKNKKPTVVDLEQLRERRYQQYDRDVVLREGVKVWTADQKLPAALDDLEERAANQLHRAILDLSLPPIDEERGETERKND